MALLAAAFALSRLLAAPATRRLRLAAAWTLAVAIGTALAAPVALPAAEYLPHSLRVSLLEARHERLQASGDGGDAEPPSSAARRHDPLARLIPNAAPNAFGNNRYGGYWGDRNIVEDAAGFAGTAALLAALAAVWPLGAGRRFPQERLMLGVALVCLLVAVRPPGTVRVLEALPVLRHSLNFHSRVTLLLDLAVAYLAACTWERWRRGSSPSAASWPPRRRWRRRSPGPTSPTPARTRRLSRACGWDRWRSNSRRSPPPRSCWRSGPPPGGRPGWWRSPPPSSSPSTGRPIRRCRRSSTTRCCRRSP